MSSNKTEMQKYLREYAIGVNTCSNSYIKKWNKDVCEMHKKIKSNVTSDIRIYFQRSIR